MSCASHYDDQSRFVPIMDEKHYTLFMKSSIVTRYGVDVKFLFQLASSGTHIAHYGCRLVRHGSDRYEFVLCTNKQARIPTPFQVQTLHPDAIRGPVSQGKAVTSHKAGSLVFPTLHPFLSVPHPVRSSRDPRFLQFFYKRG